MKKLLYVLTGLCLLAGIFAGCEKKPLDEPDNPNGGGNGGGSSQKGMIEGVVTSKSTDRPVMLASVTLLPTNTLTLTDTAGSFTLDNIEPGTYKIQVKRSGYATYTSGDIKVTAGKTVRHNVTLDVVQSDLQILDVSGTAISELNLGNSSRGTFLLQNAGEAIVEWEIPKLAADWIAGFSKQSGKLAPGAVDTVMLTIERSKLSEGENEATVYIGTNIGDKKLVIKAGVELSFCFTDSYGNEIMDVDMSSIDEYRFKIKNTGSGALTWTVGEIEANWLTFVGERNGQLSAGESESRTLQVDRTRMEEGMHETALIFKTNAGTKSLSVKNDVEMAYRLEDEYGAELTELEFGAELSQRFRIKNTGNGVLTWEVSSEGADWLTFGEKKRGNLQPGAVEILTMTIDRTKLSVGDNQATITVNTNGGEKQLNVNAHVELSYQLVNDYGAEISELDLDKTRQGVFKIKNTGDGMLEWEILPVEADWLTLSNKKSGTLQPGFSETISITIDASLLTEGDNLTTVNIRTRAGDKQLQIKAYRLPLSDIQLEMVFVEGGAFEMGTSEQGQGTYDNLMHNVTLNGFSIGKYEVTQAQWEAVMGTTIAQQRDKARASTLYGVGDNYPMYYVSWEEAVAFCQKLSEMTGKTYRLPTEAEWEYAARGGQYADGTRYAGSNNIAAVAWYNDNKTHPVGQKQANGLGLYDMSGNVWEWCSDWYGEDYYSSSPAVNPQGPTSGSGRVDRGGSWEYSVYGVVYCRVWYRGSNTPDTRYSNLGFRVVCEP